MILYMFQYHSPMYRTEGFLHCLAAFTGEATPTPVRVQSPLTTSHLRERGAGSSGSFMLGLDDSMILLLSKLTLP